MLIRSIVFVEAIASGQAPAQVDQILERLSGLAEEAVKIIAAERNAEAIAIEIKSFLGASAISEFHRALRQFMNYRAGASHFGKSSLATKV